MAQVAPFRALRPDPQACGGLAAWTTPPHDVIPPRLADALRKVPLSMVHLVLPQGGDDRFEAAEARLAGWVREGVLRRDSVPALYGYEVTHGPPASRRRMRGVFARVGLDATLRDVRPHERILPRKAGDRLRLRRTTQCDVEPIWLLHQDPEGWVDAACADGEPLAAFTDRDGAEHRLWRVTDPAVLRKVADWFRTRSLVIADGHHRYQSALEHFAATGRPEDASLLALLTRDTDPGVAVQATHRIVRWGRSVAEALAAARTAWQVRELPGPQPHDGGWQRAAAGLLQGLDGPGTAVVVGKADGRLQAAALRLAAPHADLAVTLVQERLLAGCWGLDASQAGALGYERDAAECLRAVGDGEADLAVLLPPERVETVVETALAGRLMPAKATYFVPKPPSGMVLCPLDAP